MRMRRARPSALHWVLDVRKRLELLGPQLAVNLLDLADVDVADDVARRRVDRDRAARAFEGHAFHRGNQLVAVAIAAGFLERFVDEVQTVIGAERDEGGALAGSLLKLRDVGLVERRIMRGGIRP